MTNLIKKFLARRNTQQSLGWLLQRADEHFLQDIGLTRADVQGMIDGAGPKADPAYSLALDLEPQRLRASLQRAQVCGC